MKRVTGIGGIFFKSKNPEKLQAWYQKHLGIAPKPDGCVAFEWREHEQPEQVGHTIWSPFPQDTKYFDPTTAPFMINYRVADLDQLLKQLRSEGVHVEDRIEESEFGRFAWITDPEGTRMELWEPPKKG